MLVIGADYHPSFQQIAFCDTETGECGQRRLRHSDGEAERFYRSPSGGPVGVGMEATGHSRWFERLLSIFKPCRTDLRHQIPAFFLERFSFV